MATQFNVIDSNNSSYGMDNEEWVQLVRDHYAWLRGKSTTYTLTPEDAHRWRFRLQEYIYTEHGLPYSMLWIVLWINNIKLSDFDGGILELLIPSESDIATLYTGYTATVNHV